MASRLREERTVAQSHTRRARARSAPRTTVSTSFPLIPPCLRCLPRGLHDPDLLPVDDRIGRIGDHALLLAKPPGDFDLRPKVTQYTHLFESNAVVKRDCHL